MVTVGAIALTLIVAAPSYATCLNNADDFGFIPAGSTQQVTEAYPQVFWKLGAHHADKLQISVMDKKSRELYFWNQRLVATTGSASDPAPAPTLMSVQAPSELPTIALGIGEQQTWELTLICDEGDRSQDITITQEIQRVAEDQLLNSPIDTLSTLKKIETYLAQGLVHSALSEFVNWQTDKDTMETPSNVYDQWVNFPKKVGIMESH